MKHAWLALLTSIAMMASFTCNAELHKGEKLNLKDGGMLCRTLDGAIATRDVAITNEQGGKADMFEATRRFSCLSYSMRPLTFVKYDDYLIPGYEEKGKVFASVIEPRSGEVWHIFTGFLEK